MTDIHNPKAPAPAVATPRIGAGQLSLAAGMICLAMPVLAGLASAGGPESAGAISGAFGVIALALLALGVLKRLFHMIERRLIDIQED
jgi:hypothetical protein